MKTAAYYAYNVHLPARGVHVIAAHHPHYTYSTNRQTTWSNLPRSLPPQKSEEESAQAFEDSATFASLLQDCSQTTATTTASEASSTPAVVLRPGTNGRGIFSTTEIPSSSKVVFNVPLNTCLVVDYSHGFQLPSGGWPRVQRGLAKDDALPWDIIHALALLDGLAGDGNEFWSRYTNEILPSPESLTLPVCLPEELLTQLEHKAIIEAARQQKQRLNTLFPGLSVPLCDNGPTYLEWAFACVRSRAFRLGQDIFAFIPFLDAVNHNIDPNTNFEMSVDGKRVNLVSVKEIKQDEELTISYTGTSGCTNQRYMAQYGFVPLGGNPFDRIVFQCIEDGNTSTRTGEVEGGDDAGSVIQSGPVLLSVDALMNLFGDGEAMVDAFSGRDAFMYAALKSLPLAAMESDAAPMAKQLELARKMLNEVESEQKEWKTGIEEDTALLIELTETANEKRSSVDPRFEAVVRYRLYRKEMVNSSIKVLRAFIRGS